MSKVNQGLLVWCDGELLDGSVLAGVAQGANGRYDMTADVSFMRDIVCVDGEVRYLCEYFDEDHDTYSWHVWVGGDLVNIQTISPLCGVYESRYMWEGREFLVVQGRDVAMSVFEDLEVESYVLSMLEGVAFDEIV